MHELAIAQEIVRRAVAEAQRRNAVRVKALHVRLGPVGFATSENLSFCITAACKGTIAEGARVDVRNATRGGIVLTSVELQETRNAKAA